MHDRGAKPVHGQDREWRCHPQRHAHPTGTSGNDSQCIPVGPGHCEVAALEDGRLLAGDGVDRGAEVLHVVECHVGDGRDAPVPRVRGVESTTQANLDDGRVDPRPGEPEQCGTGQRLELGGWPMTSGEPVGRIEDLEDQRPEVGRRDGRAVDHDAFPVTDQVWLGCLAHPLPSGRQH